jgi:NADH-quinone oxidoreductase subunit N
VLLVLVGIAFKLAAFPFHFWCPDAFEGAAAEIGAFLSVASKGAAFALLVRFCLALVGHAPVAQGELSPLYYNVGIGLGIVAAVTTTFGNLAAYAQTNMKRLLAYSTIAHAGYMLMAVASLIVIQTTTELPTAIGGPTITDRSARAVEGLMYYLSAYLFMNLGAFAITALIRNEIFSEEIEDYAGLGYQCPVLAVGMAVCLCSLIGLPPLGGFVGKLFVFAALYDAGQVHGLMWGILVVAGLNTVFSLVYYMNVLKVMYLQQRPAGAKRVQLPATSSTGVYVMLLTLPLLVPLGIYPEWISRVANSAARALFH